MRPATRSDSVMRAIDPLTRNGIGRPIVLIGQTSGRAGFAPGATMCG